MDGPIGFIGRYLSGRLSGPFWYGMLGGSLFHGVADEKGSDYLMGCSSRQVRLWLLHQKACTVGDNYRRPDSRVNSKKAYDRLSGHAPSADNQ